MRAVVACSVDKKGRGAVNAAADAALAVFLNTLFDSVLLDSDIELFDIQPDFLGPTGEGSPA